MHYRFSEDFARQADVEDSLAPLRDEFIFPSHQGQPALYFTGNSLGLQPRKAKTYLLEELEDWGNLGGKAIPNRAGPGCITTNFLMKPWPA
ncbi:MAG: hypothetical protein U5L96_18910 [Owenweeksia sp.]|nr:hypothetical protein [Owenweeksia sp.]